MVSITWAVDLRNINLYVDPSEYRSTIDSLFLESRMFLIRILMPARSKARSTAPLSKAHYAPASGLARH